MSRKAGPNDGRHFVAPNDPRRRPRHDPLPAWVDLPERPPEPYEIRQFMRRHDLRRPDLARLFGVTPAAVQKWLQDPEGTATANPAPRALWHMIRLADDQGAIPEPPAAAPDKEALRRWIVERRLTQGKFAALAGVRLNTLTEWLAGSKPVPRYVWHVMRAVDHARQQQHQQAGNAPAGNDAAAIEDEDSQAGAPAPG